MSVLLTMVCGTMLANNVLTANEVSIRNGKNATLIISIENEMNVVSFDFLLYLPDGISVVWDDELEDYDWAWCDRVPRNSRGPLFSMVVTPAADGSIVFGAYSPTFKMLNGNDGPVLTITLHADNETVGGTGYLKAIALGDETGLGGEEHSVHPDDVTFDIKALPTNISSTGTFTIGHDIIYNTAGQQIDKPRKGINIQSGKKVLVK